MRRFRACAPKVETGFELRRTRQSQMPMSQEPESPAPKMEIAPPRPLSPAAQRALAEAQERRRTQEEREAGLARVREVNGRGGHDPVRYDDWEIKGIASDF